jgi:hypothetical protein
MGALAALMPLLRLDRQGSDRTGFETLERDRLAGLLAVAVGAVLNPLDGGVDLGDQLPLAIPGPQLERAVGFGRRAIGDIRLLGGILLQMLQRCAGNIPSCAGS